MESFKLKAIEHLEIAIRNDQDHIPSILTLCEIYREIGEFNKSQTLLEYHVLIDESNMQYIERIKKTIKDFLSASYNIHHSTLEFEWIPCADEHSDCR